ncbi:MAG: FHA domain-containing protein [Planctomycetota bacterium]|nr:FHA domain-containing protein [Planctomycetota bacterium]
MKPKLIVVGGDAKPSEIDLTLPSVIGRGRSVAVTLPHPLVSREHCEIYLNEGRLHVRDLGSLNGTYVGNERIEDVVLPAGGLLTVGTVTFRAVYEDPAAAVAEDDLSFSIADSESDDLTVGPDEPLSSRTTAMLTSGGVNDGDAESVESETESLERILESLGTSPSKEVELKVSPSADQDESEDSAEADDENDSTDDDDDFQTFLRNHS